MTGHRPAALVNGDGGGGGSASRRLRCLCRPGCQQGASACAGACSRALARARVRVCSGNGDLYAAYAAAAPIARSSLALRLPLAVAMLHSTHVCARCGRCRARGESEREREREKGRGKSTNCLGGNTGVSIENNFVRTIPFFFLTTGISGNKLLPGCGRYIVG
jgi:hypothetical protein